MITFYTNMVQGIMSRMANNSANCKAWAITIIAAILVFSFDKNNGIAGMPAVMCVFILLIFWLLDAFYLGYEREFKEQLNTTIDKAATNESLDISILKIDLHLRFCQKLCNTIKAGLSFSTFGLYGVMIAILLIVARFQVQLSEFLS